MNHATGPSNLRRAVVDIARSQEARLSFATARARTGPGHGHANLPENVTRVATETGATRRGAPSIGELRNSDTVGALRSLESQESQ